MTKDQSTQAENTENENHLLATVTLIPIDPTKIYLSVALAQTWGLNPDPRREWYRRLKDRNDVGKAGHHYILTGQVALETLAELNN